MLAWISQRLRGQRLPPVESTPNWAPDLADATIECRTLTDATLAEIELVRREGFHVVALQGRSWDRYSAVLVRRVAPAPPAQLRSM